MSGTQALANSRYMSLLNVACILGACVVIDGPLLQRASTVVPAIQFSNKKVNIELAPELPTGFSGIFRDGKMYSTMAPLKVLPDYAANVPMQLDYSPECDGTCHAKILAPGVAKTKCSSRTWPITYDMMHDPNATWGPRGLQVKGSTNYLPLFYVDVSMNFEQPTTEAAKVRTGIASWLDWQGSFVETVCYLIPAVLEYKVEISEGSVSIAEEASKARIVNLANNTKPLNTSPNYARIPQNDTMDGITVGVSILANAHAKAIFTPGSGQKSWTWDSTTYNLETFRHQQWSDLHGSGSVSFSDPMPGIVSTFNQLFFRGAILTSFGSTKWKDLDGYLDPGLSTRQTIESKQSINQNVFRSDLRWYAAAAVLELVTVLVVMPMFWGWWTLGCNISMSPFAVALAFDSTIFKDVNSASGSKGVVEDMGSVTLKFGVVDRLDQTTTLTGKSAANENGFGRLGVGKSENVITPRPSRQFWE